MAVPWLKVASVGITAVTGILSAAQDGKVTVEEALKVVVDVCKQLGAVFDDEKTIAALNAVMLLVAAAADKKITIAELVGVGERICADLGIDLDTKGLKIPA